MKDIILDFICIYIFGYFIAWAILVTPYYYSRLCYFGVPTDPRIAAAVAAITSWFFILYAIWDLCCRLWDYLKRRRAIRGLERMVIKKMENGDVLGAEDLREVIQALRKK